MTGRIPFLDLAAMTREVRAPVDLAWRRALASSRFEGLHHGKPVLAIGQGPGAGRDALDEMPVLYGQRLVR